MNMDHSRGGKCSKCGKVCLKGRHLCPPCRVGHRVSPVTDVMVAPLSSDGAKSLAVRQWFLSKWYGHGGPTVRVEAIVGVYSYSQAARYATHQESLGSVEGIPKTLNERRMFLQNFPKLNCKFWSSDSTSELCHSQCDVCTVAQSGPIPNSVSDSPIPVVTLVHEPILSTAGINAPGEGAMKWKAATRRVCFVCRATLGTMGWCNGFNRIQSRAAMTNAVDSWLVEVDGEQSVVAVDISAAVLPTYAIVFSVA